MRKKWTPIKFLVTKAVREQGHTIGFFERNRRTPDVLTAICEICGAVCWVAFSETRGYTGGGRAAKYRCGTPEAMGMLRQEVVSTNEINKENENGRTAGNRLGS